jgi:hypothetical protein
MMTVPASASLDDTKKRLVKRVAFGLNAGVETQPIIIKKYDFVRPKSNGTGYVVIGAPKHVKDYAVGVACTDHCEAGCIFTFWRLMKKNHDSTTSTTTATKSTTTTTTWSDMLLSRTPPDVIYE